MDYLPHALRAWLEEAELQDSCRENLVITHSGDSVIGFLSLYFLSSRSRAVKFAFRVHRQAAAPHQARDSDAVQECAGAGLGAGRVLYCTVLYCTVQECACAGSLTGRPPARWPSRSPPTSWAPSPSPSRSAVMDIIISLL